MKYYSYDQEQILFNLEKSGSIDVSVDADDIGTYNFLEQEGLISRKSLVNRTITFTLSKSGVAYLRSLRIDAKRYNDPLKLSKIALVLSAIAIAVSIASTVLNLCL